MLSMRNTTVNGRAMSIVSGTLHDLPAVLNVANIPAPNKTAHVETVGPDRNRDTYAFGDVKNMADAVAIFTAKGWQAGADRARAEMPTLDVGHLVPTAAVPKRRRIVGAEGDTVRVEQAIAGQWETAFESRAKRLTRAPVALSIGCGFGGNYNIGHESFFWTGLQMAAICELLERAGWRVELRALKSNDVAVDGGFTNCQDWTVKRADQPLRLDTTLALFGHGGVYRTYGWAANYATRRKIGSTSNVGPVQDTAAMRKTFASLAAAGEIPPLSLIVPQAYDRPKCIANIRAALSELAPLLSGGR